MMSMGTYRWLLGARGVIAIAMGAIALTFPLATIYTVLLFLAAWVLIDAGFAVAAAIARRAPISVALVRAGIGIAAGILLLARPDISATVLVAIVGVWAVVIGVIEIFAGVEVFREVHEAPWLALAGLASMAFGVILLARPVAGAIALAWMAGFYALFSGLALVVLAASLRRWPGSRGRFATSM